MPVIPTRPSSSRWAGSTPVPSRRHPGSSRAGDTRGSTGSTTTRGTPPCSSPSAVDGRIVRRFRLAIPNLDWEDIAIDDQGHLYLGDIGNNARLLRVRTIYQLDEPDPSIPEGGDGDRPSARQADGGLLAAPSQTGSTPRAWCSDRGTAILIAKYLDGREAEVFAVPIDSKRAAGAPGPAPVRPIGKLPGFTEPANWCRPGARTARGFGGLLVPK